MPGSWEIPNPYRLQYFGPFFNGSGAVRVIHAALWYNPEFGAACRVLGFEQGRFVEWETPTVYLWNPASAPIVQSPDDPDLARYFTVVPNRRTNLFCAGHTHLSDGSVLFANVQFWEIGALGSAQPCTRNSDIFNSTQPEWNIPTPPGYVRMGRWYPTLVREAAGDVFVFSGLSRNLAPRGYVRPVEVFRAASRSYEALPAEADLPLDQEPYGFFYLCPNGPVFFAGGESKTAWLSRSTTSGQYAWLATEPNDEHSEHWSCTSVMYEPGLVLKIGGHATGGVGDATDKVSFIDVRETYNQPPPPQPPALPSWTLRAPLAPIPNTSPPLRGIRMNATALALPEGSIAVVGGNRRLVQVGPDIRMADGVRYAEFFDPRDASPTAPRHVSSDLPVNPEEASRAYHSIALLLDDARILVAGGDPVVTDSLQAKYPTFRLLRPPYFDGNPVRPRIDAGLPHEMQYGGEYEFTYSWTGTPPAQEIMEACLIGFGSVTHGFDQGARFVPLALGVVGDPSNRRLRVTLPTNRNLAPPGPFTLWLVSKHNPPTGARGVPCERAHKIILRP